MIPQRIFEATLLDLLYPVRAYLDDPEVSEILINGIDCIYVERRGKLTRTDARFPHMRALLAALRNIAQYSGKFVDEERPILEGRLPDGSRIAAVLPPVAPRGPSVAIRRFFKETLTVARLLQFGSFTQEVREVLEVLVASKLNVVVAGGTSSGKTSMLNALSSFIPEHERVVVIEDSAELQLQRDHVVQLEARAKDAQGRGQVSIRDLFKTTLRMRPDRIVIGELRGGEALDLVQAMTSGHGGCLTTLHATYPRDVLTRLETMAMMSDVDLPLAALRAQIASAVNIVVQVSRLRDGSRKVTHISEICGYCPERGKYEIQDLFRREYRGLDSTGKVQSDLLATGTTPRCAELIENCGFELPKSMTSRSTEGEKNASIV
jgi:pilus assembly protein CpaF